MSEFKNEQIGENSIQCVSKSSFGSVINVMSLTILFPSFSFPFSPPLPFIVSSEFQAWNHSQTSIWVNYCVDRTSEIEITILQLSLTYMYVKCRNCTVSDNQQEKKEKKKNHLMEKVAFSFFIDLWTHTHKTDRQMI